MVNVLSPVRLRFLSAKILFFILISILMLSASALNSQEEAGSRISEAEQSLTQAYNAVLDGESAGVNISRLLARLNVAAATLSEAKVAFEVGNFDEALRLAELSNESALVVETETESLKVETANTRLARSQIFIGSSILGVSFVLSASLLGFRYFKRRYYRRLLKMKPRIE